MSDRIERVRQLLEESSLDAILVSSPYNRRYLTGFREIESCIGEAVGHALVSKNTTCIFTNPLYTEQVKVECEGVEQYTYTSSPFMQTAEMLRQNGVKRLGFEPTVMYVSSFRKLEKALGGDVELVDVEDKLDTLRAIKDGEELDKIRKAVEIADEAFIWVAGNLVEGVTEREVAWQLEKYMREHGAEASAFDIIVAAGPYAALPHSIPGDKEIEPGDPVVIDMGARVDGYNSDLTRTICVGPQTEQFRTIYDIVLKANLAAEASMRAGQTAKEADGFARQVIEEAGYGEAFNHSLGHGVGLSIHEYPTLRQTADNVLLKENMVVTVEPGIYVPGWGGVRIEDTVIIMTDGVEVLTKAPKEVLPK